MNAGRLPGKHEALSSIPNTAKKQEKREKKKKKECFLTWNHFHCFVLTALLRYN
jgi:hypothetical protein